MVSLIKILVAVIKALIFLEKLGIPVEDVIAQLEAMLGTGEEGTEDTSSEAVPEA